MTVATIAPGRGFVDALAHGLLRDAADPLDLGAATVLLPGRRAGRALRQAFLRATGGRATILPRIMPAGGIDTDLLGFAGAELPTLAPVLEIAPPIPPLARAIQLTRLVMRADPGLGIDQAVRHATALGRLLDEVATEELSFDALAGLVPHELADHWRRTLTFLEIVTHAWPEHLAAAGRSDPGRHATLLIDALAAQWAAAPPSGRVIAAGFVGTSPAVRRLLAVVAGLPGGTVVLPGLDAAVSNADWLAIDDAHPQHPLKLILEAIGIERSAVVDWGAGEPTPRIDRAILVRETMRPAETTEAWRAPEGVDAEALTGLSRIDCKTSREEADVVALLLREALETPGRTAALVTPDRTLARRVAARHAPRGGSGEQKGRGAHPPTARGGPTGVLVPPAGRLARRVATLLARWGVSVDDSGGRPLADTAVGAFLRLVADAAHRRLAPVALLALLKHPLTALGDAPQTARAVARRLERTALRGPGPAPGIPGLAAALDDRADGALRAWTDRLIGAIEPFVSTVDLDEARPADLLRRQVAAAEALAATADEPGTARLWRGEEGEAAQALVAELIEALDDLAPVAGRPAWAPLFEALLEGAVVRPRWGTHPRLAILGPLEARLERFDLTVLGGLNEGTWPAPPPIDPWMSRPMRRAFGLPSPERSVGRSAHDFALGFAGGEVVLTRAAMVEGTPTVPSRWLMRLGAVLRGAALALDESTPARVRAVAATLDAADAATPVDPPRPRPPVGMRPRVLTLSDVGTLMTDPYALYARRILRLVPLEPLEADAGVADRGTVIHEALADFLRAHPAGPLPADALDRLLGFGRAAFATLPDRVEIGTFWWPRFVRIAEWFVAEEGRRRADCTTLAIEVEGGATFDAPAGPVTLRARADRIDRVGDGRLVVIDYKTGSPPTKDQVEAGHAPQLPLEAAVARLGGFEGVPPAPAAALEYWKLSGGAEAGRRIDVSGGDADATTDAAVAGLRSVLARFDMAETPYLSQPRRTPPRFSDYAHLARVKEWASEGGDE